MAKTETKNAPGAGRPSAEKSDDPKQNARNQAQYALDRACSFIADAPNTSYVAKVARAARAGSLTRDQALRGLRDGVGAAMKDAEAAIGRIFDAPQAPAQVKRRVSLA